MQKCDRTGEVLQAVTETKKFPSPLSDFIIRENGNPTFCYPMEVGAFISIIKHADGLLKQAERLKGKEKTKALRVAADYVADARAEHELIHRQWDAYLES